MLIGTAAPAASTESRRPLAVDDVLKISEFGGAVFSSDGRWLAYNLTPPYDELSDYSNWLYAYDLTGHRLWIKDLSGNGKPRLQPGLDLKATNYLFGFSPDSKRVVSLELKTGRLRFVACSVGRDHCVRFDNMPDILDGYFVPELWNQRLSWTSPHTFVMPTRDPDLPGSELQSRGTVGRFLWREWNKAWGGKESTASEVVSTGRDRSEDWASGELIEFDILTGTTRMIADGRYAEVRLSPDNRFLAASHVGERIRPAADAHLVPAETHPVFDRRYALNLIDMKSGQIRKIAEPFNVDPGSVTWSADGKSLAVFGWDHNEISSQGRLYIVDANTLLARRLETKGYILANNRVNENSPWAQSMGPARTMLLDAGLVILARPSSGDRYDWFLFEQNGGIRNLSEGLRDVSGIPLFSDAGSITMLTSEGAYRIAADGSRTRLTSQRDGTFIKLTARVNSAHSWTNPSTSFKPTWAHGPFDKEGAIIIKDRNTVSDSAVALLNYSSSQVPADVLDLHIQGAMTLAASRAANAAVVTVKAGAATRLLLVHNGRPPEELVRVNEYLNQLEFPKTKIISYLLKDPNDQKEPRNPQACLILPPGYEEGKRYPVVLDIYPTDAPRGCDTLRETPLPYAMTKDLWAARGFIYVRPSIPLDFARTKDGPISGMGAIVDQMVDALVEQGYAEKSKVVLFGFSQGGMPALEIATQSKKFAAVISMNSWADLFSHYFGARGIDRYFHLDQNGGDNRWRYDCMGHTANDLCRFGFGVTALDDPEIYARNSPVAHAKDITAPVLLIHSDLDYFDMAQYDEMFGALYRAGKEARYVRYWGEGHGPSSPANIRDLWRRIDEFLQEHGIEKKSN
jgi:dipeptidyl aminopeptidase/acylaminoacyl peptidase